MAVLTGTNGKMPSYSPSRANSRADVYVYVHWKAVDRLRQAVGAVLEVIRKSTIVGRFRPNATGRKVSGTIDFSGYRVKVSLCLTQAHGSGNRTDDSLLTEVIDVLLARVDLDLRRSKNGASGLDVGRFPVYALFGLLNEIADLKRQRDPSDGAYFNIAVARDILASEIIPAPGNLSKVIREFRDISESGAATTNFSSHEAGKALKDFKKCALHALSNGMDVEVLDRTLREALVEVTIRS
jgi:hypothetical protein